MTIQEYQTLTGTTVPESDVVRVKAIIRRSEAKLEGLLGYSLSRQKNWTERGKVQSDGYLPFPSLPIDDDTMANLLPASKEIGDTQLFRFDSRDTHIKINPAQEIYKARLVLPISNDEYITVTELDNVVPYLNDVGLVTAITRYNTWFTWHWWGALNRFDRKGLMIAVEGDFVNVCDINRYSDLAFLLADMVAYYSDSSFSLMGIIKSESIDSHSYSRASTGTTVESTAPEGQPSAKVIIAKYAGPAAYRKIIA